MFLTFVFSRFFHNSSRDQNQVPARKTSPVPRESPLPSGDSLGKPPLSQGESLGKSPLPQGDSLGKPQVSQGESLRTAPETLPQQSSVENSESCASNHTDQQGPMSSEQPQSPMDEPGVADPAPEENGANTHNSSGRTPQEEARYKRQFVIQELVDTERDYVTDLSLVVEGYMAALDSMDLPEDLQGKDKIIFANIGQILDFHKNTFLKEIEKCLEDYEAAGTAFTKYERRLHTYYVKYCQNKPKSDFLMSQEQFEQFFAETRLKLGQKRTLTDLLIKPVQRIQKYQLLMKDILKYTERAGDSMEKLKKGFEVMCVVPKACDDMMQVGRLQNFDGNLNAQGKLLFQGLLQISECSPSQPFKGKERIVFLFEQSAIIADSIPKRNEFSSPTYIFKNQIMVNKMVLENNVADEPTRFVLRSNDPNQTVAFLCQANSVEEKEQWLEKISAQLDQQKTFLAALVDPKKYQNQLASSMGSISLGNSKKDSSGSLGTPGTGSPTSALNSPKHSTPPSAKGSKLFGFNKKSSNSNN
ncbi:hypothetical protein FO519_006733 [Halicephalobus sp. NKZ332]|nr:hypothetical protein FO519_006733 [Halicephalobus sp. NKZ332]